MIKRSIALTAAILAATGCGTMPEERAISGAGIGAAAGAALGAVTGMSVAQGAVIGALGGGLTGAMTRRDQVNLGDPAWKQNAGAGTSGAGTVADIQRGLRQLGYDPGPVDGVAGNRTAQAIRAYQRDHGLLVDGRVSAALADHIRRQSS